jgi:hypothetical protein
MNIQDTLLDWFEVIGKILHDLAILPENIYSMDETEAMLSILGSMKAVVGKEDIWDYRGAGMK